MTNKKSSNLIWIDLEMTGLNPKIDRILEIAVVVTDDNLNLVAVGPDIAIHNSSRILAKMDEWNTNQHGKSGLVERVLNSDCSLKNAEIEVLEFIKLHVVENKSPMCGSTIYQDRKFLAKYMPQLEKYFHYRNLDVSSVKILAKNWYPNVAKKLKKKTSHRALSDIYDSISELKFYKENIFVKRAILDEIS